MHPKVAMQIVELIPVMLSKSYYYAWKEEC